MTEILTRLKKRFGYRFRQAIREALRRFRRRLRYRGRARYCPVCRSHVREFLPFHGPVLRPDVACPVCSSHERHRLMWLYFERRPELLRGAGLKLLHIAPEECLAGLFLRPNIDYLSGGLEAPPAMVQIDLTNIEFPDATFDAIYCSHVLEHIPDDRKAMAELHRVLKPSGWAILQVPGDASLAETYEDWSIQFAEERARAFGQADHVRVYGRDYADRLRAAGFQVTVDSCARELPESEILRLGLLPTEEIFFCRKAGSPVASR